MNHSSSNNKISFRTTAIMKEFPMPSPPTYTAPTLLQAGLFLVINVWRLSSEKGIITSLTSLPTPAVILVAARSCNQKGFPCLEIWMEVRKKAAGCKTECVQGVAGEQPPSPSPGSTIVEEQLFSCFACGFITSISYITDVKTKVENSVASPVN